MLTSIMGVYESMFIWVYVGRKRIRGQGNSKSLKRRERYDFARFHITDMI